MKLDKTRNVIQNTMFGLLSQLLSMIAPFILRTIILYELGTEYLGLNSLFTSILGVLGIAELGFGNAIGFYMYKPIADDDSDSICAFVNLYKKCYTVIGFIILACGILILPFLNEFVKGGCPSDINLYVLYCIYLCDTVMSYFMYAYKAALFNTHQRESVLSFYRIILNLILYSFKNYYIYIVFKPLYTIVYNIFISRKADKEYAQYIGKKRLVSKEIKKNVYVKVLALFGHKLGNAVINSADNIVISTFLGLSMVGLYGNYYHIFSVLVAFLSIWHNSMTAGIGNELYLSSDSNLKKNFEIVSLLNNWVVSWCTICLLCLYQPFMELWVGSENMLSFSTVIFFAIDFYVWQVRKIVLTYKDAGGLWNEDFWKPYIGAAFNLSMNIILVKNWGINGVLVSTIVSMGLIYTPWETMVLYHKIFKTSVKEFWIKYVSNALICIIGAILTYGVCALFCERNIVGFILKCAVCIILPNVIIYFFFRKNIYYIEMKNKFLSILRRKIL